MSCGRSRTGAEDARRGCDRSSRQHHNDFTFVLNEHSAAIRDLERSASGWKWYSARFPTPDRGEPIPYLVDATVLPAGDYVEQRVECGEQRLRGMERGKQREIQIYRNSKLRHGFGEHQHERAACSESSCNDAYNFIPETVCWAKADDTPPHHC